MAESEEKESPEPITIDDFAKVDLRVGTIRTAQPHPNADRLLVVEVDIGEESPRTLVAGIREAYDPSVLVGQQVVVVANLKPAKLRGVQSCGMLLAGRDESGLTLLSPGKRLKTGTRVS